jgi:hypothetical protein
METLSEIAPILIALCALALSIQQGGASRKQAKDDAKNAELARQHEQALFEENKMQSRLSCRPHLTSHMYADFRNEGVFTTYSVSNHGLGPAFIKDVKLFLDGHALELGREPIKGVIKEAFGCNDGVDVKRHSWMKSGYALPEKANYEYGLIFFQGVNQETYPEIEKVIERIQVLIDYASIQGEGFVFDSTKD